mmetsp:Transcript_38056/g.38408  ORF Transcript_38056/g.38408 Transcript_38056/m.38408 type:complete len:203 (-) Transcript_38056:61-669(-)
MWVNAKLSVGSSLKTTPSHNEENECNDTFLVRGIIDRIDMEQFLTDNTETTIGLRIIDYKSGKAPQFKYTSKVNERIADETFWQLKIYALLLREMMRSNKANYLPKIDVRMLRLMYLTSHKNDEAVFLDMDLGASKEERDMVLDKVHEELSAIWTEIQELVSMRDPKVFVHCDRSFCFCHKLRPKFRSGTVWERSQEHLKKN